MHDSSLKRWEHAAEWPLMVAAALFLAAYATQIIAQPHGGIETVCDVVLWATWLAFVVDYVMQLRLAERRWHWFSRHLLDLAVVVLPMFRPLRLMRFLTIVALIQRSAGNLLRGRAIVYSVGATILTTLIAGLAVLDAERGNGGTIQNYGDAVWWAFCTIATVGYGDYTPITATGRAIAVGLMAGGIALLGVVTATVASWIVERISADTEEAVIEAEAESRETELRELRSELAELKEMIGALGSGGQEGAAARPHG